MMPTTSILALCYNHAAFLEEALQSLEMADGPEVEILVADDASTDHSVEILKQWQIKKPHWVFVFHELNQGNCKTFNELLRLANGSLILDFSTDDRLISSQFSNWVQFMKMHPEAGFCYADAAIIDQKGHFLHQHSEKVKPNHFPEGNILAQLFNPHFFCPPAVLFRKSALDKLGGYNELLHYEDWDIWLRIAREFPVYRFPHAVIEYRKHPDSLSASIFQKRNRLHLQSTVEILQQVNQWPELLKDRNWENFVRYQLKVSGSLQLKHESVKFYQMLFEAKKTRISDMIFKWLAHVPLPIYRLTQLIWKWRS